MAYKVIILYQLYMPSYFLGTFTEYPYWRLKSNIRFYKGVFCLFGHPLLFGKTNDFNKLEIVFAL